MTLAAIRTPTHTVGILDDPAAHFAADAKAIREAIGERLIGLVDVKWNQVLIAIWKRPEARELGNGKRLLLPDAHRDEDQYQGKTGLVLKLGPHAFESDDSLIYSEEDKVNVGDWVVFRRGDGMLLRLYGTDCLLTTERGIKLRLPRPDAVY
jgi:co-chaperonin GroES (HSP10)